MIRKLLTLLGPHIAFVLSVLGLAFLVSSVWTIGRAELGTTLGLAATGLALLVIPVGLE